MPANAKTASAEKPDLLPSQNLVSPDQIRQDFVRMEFTPLGNTKLKMFFLVPKDWQSKAIKVSKKALLEDRERTIPLVLVTNPKDNARIEVSYVRISGKADLKKWALAYLAGNGLKLQEAQPGTFSGRKVFDTLARTPPGDLVRLTFSQHHDRIIILAGSTSAKAYPKLARTLGIATVSFKMNP